MKTLVTLDTLEALVVLNPGETTEPPFCLNLTIGELCLFACKDSFSIFMGTVGELTMEMTAETLKQKQQSP